jgi:hypothetical protein
VISSLRREVARPEWPVERIKPYLPVDELGDGDRQSIDSGPIGGRSFAT